MTKRLDIKIESTGCYTCVSHCPNSKGYPVMSTNGKKDTIYRKVYEECFGEIPEGMLVRHKCDNRMCINPEHLEIGTHQDNMNDKMKRGRHKNNPARGEKQAFSKLKEYQIKDILKDKRVHGEIAKQYGVSRQTIQLVKSRKTWKHVEVRDE